MGRGRFEISCALLRDVLHLPPDTEIIGSRQGTVILYVEHPDIPERPSCEWEELDPQLAREGDQVVFKGWK